MMRHGLQVIPVTRAPRDVHRFLQVSYNIYRNDPHWVAPLLLDARKVLSDANPFFQHAEMQLWIATCNGRDVGRIAGILDQNHHQVHADHAAYFGFFECEEDSEASRQLFAAALNWASERGARRMLGPMNPTTNDECGLLVEGFDSSPLLMMTYNPPYYADLIAAADFVKAKNLFAFHIDVAQCPLERLQRIARQTRRRNPELIFRAVRRQTLAADLDKLKEIYNSAWRKNWGFVPLTGPEIDFLAARLKPLLQEGLVWIAETPNEPVGFMLCLPDYNEALKPLRGRLWTSKILQLLPYALGRKLPARCRVITLGVKEAYRNRGVEAVMLAEGLIVGRRLGIKHAEASWVLEDNLPMRRLLEPFGGRIYKTYRLYEREL